MILDENIVKVLGYSVSVLLSGAGLRFGLGGVKLLTATIIPLLKNGGTTRCPYHDTMGSKIDQVARMSDTLIRIETTLEGLVDKVESNHTEFTTVVKDLFTRLNKAEIDIAIQKAKKQ